MRSIWINVGAIVLSYVNTGAAVIRE